jgi:hypothetical protein
MANADDEAEVIEALARALTHPNGDLERGIPRLINEFRHHKYTVQFASIHPLPSEGGPQPIQLEARWKDGYPERINVSWKGRDSYVFEGWARMPGARSLGTVVISSYEREPENHAPKYELTLYGDPSVPREIAVLSRHFLQIHGGTRLQAAEMGFSSDPSPLRAALVRDLQTAV